MPQRNKKELKTLALGQKTAIPQSYGGQILERFAHKNPHSKAWTGLLCTEFTSICPKTGQPDFGRLTINYVARKWMVESKSLKLYLLSFRNHGDFHEDCVQTICDDLVKLLTPYYLEVVGEFNPRGGIAIYPYSSYAGREKFFTELRGHRSKNYAPGKYSMPLSQIY